VSALLTVAGSPVAVEALNDAAQNIQRRAGGVGIAAVGDDLERCGRTREQVALEILIDLDHEQRAAAVDPSGMSWARPRSAWRSKTRDPSRCDAKPLTRRYGPDHRRVGDRVEVKAGRIAEDHALQHGRQKDDERLRGSFNTARNSLRISARIRSNEAYMRTPQPICLTVANGRQHQRRGRRRQNGEVDPDHAGDVARENQRLQQRDRIARRQYVGDAANDQRMLRRS